MNNIEIKVYPSSLNNPLDSQEDHMNYVKKKIESCLSLLSFKLQYRFIEGRILDLFYIEDLNCGKVFY